MNCLFDFDVTLKRKRFERIDVADHCGSLGFRYSRGTETDGSGGFVCAGDADSCIGDAGGYSGAGGEGSSSTPGEFGVV
jgi:hypothetical protein